MRSIDADKLINLIEGHSKYSGDALLAAIICMAEGKEINKKITPLDEEKGKWIIDGIYQYCIPIFRSYYPAPLNYYKCSRCNGESKVQFNFCPHCGEAMEVEE